ncbi:MAG: hypothetical protein ACKVX9_15025, partial [Blastocatellia bacterium]
MAEFESMLTSMYRERAASRRIGDAVGRLNAPDRLTIGYLLFSTALIAVCHGNIAQWKTLLPIHLALIAAILGLSFARARGVPVLS